VAILYAFLTLVMSHNPASVRSLNGSGVPWIEDWRCCCILSLVGVDVVLVVGGGDDMGSSAVAVRLDTGTGTLMTRRLVVESWMPNLRKASRICRTSKKFG
jgi:hypothetical protein